MLPVLLPVLPAYAWETGARTDVALSEIAPAYAATSVNTAIFRVGALVSNDSLQYACFYDPEGRVTLARRHFGASGW